MQQTLAQFDASLRQLRARSSRFGQARLLAFAVLAGALIAFGAGWAPGAWLAGVVLVLFVFLVARHDTISNEQRELTLRRQLVAEEVARGEQRRGDRVAPVLGTTSALERGEQIYAPEPEGFRLDDGAVDDLQLLTGPRPLFGYLDVSSTVFGARRLRRYLECPLLDDRAIQRRQGVVAELAERGDVRRRLLELLLPLRDQDFAPVAPHLRDPRPFAGRRGLFWAATLFGTLAPALLVGAVFMPTLLVFLAPLIVVNVVMIGSHIKQSNVSRDRLLLLAPLLDGLLAADRGLADGALQSDTGEAISAVFAKARPTLLALRRRVRWLELHSMGVAFELFNVLSLWELRVLPGAEALAAAHQDEVERAIGALGDLEALLSLATLLAEHDDFIVPEVLPASAPATIEGSEMGHPLLDPGEVVRNSVRIGDDPRVMLVTGSNMAGKSTYLKTVGANLMLAGAGGPVCAQSFRWTPMRLYTDVNVRDSLDDGKSYFQVEVERVRDVIDAAERGDRLLAIFDELFRGTNSVERVAIAAAILRHLRDRGALLLVATHDIALADLVTVDKEVGMQNFHFQESVENDAMTFDYRLHDGPAQTRNAIRVLDISGYPETIVAESRERAG